MKTIEIKGMSCGHCVKTVSDILSKVENVTDVAVSLEKGEASFEESGPVDMDKLRTGIKMAGFEAGAEK